MAALLAAKSHVTIVIPKSSATESANFYCYHHYYKTDAAELLRLSRNFLVYYSFCNSFCGIYRAPQRKPSKWAY